MNPKSQNCLSLRVPLADLAWLRERVAPGRRLSDVVRELISASRRSEEKKSIARAARAAKKEVTP
jgi:Arc/MetJ-type ribon-helix-helix transcriptional regulator